MCYVLRTYWAYCVAFLSMRSICTVLVPNFIRFHHVATVIIIAHGCKALGNRVQPRLELNTSLLLLHIDLKQQLDIFCNV